MTDATRPPSRRPKCPSCGAVIPAPLSADERAARPAWAPFCSERCKMVDLARWLGGEHAIPGEAAHIAEPEGEA